jgi:hypothetical protein
LLKEDSMREDSKSSWQLTKEAPEEAWAVEYSRYEADREFRRARRKAMIRLLRCVFLGRHRPSNAVESATPTKDGVTIFIEAIVGMIDARGRKVSHLPPLHRRLAGAWRRAFCRGDVETYPALAVCSGSGGWYLMGDPVSLLYLEIMRAKAWRQIRVRELPEQRKSASRNMVERCPECRCTQDQRQLAS